MTVHDTIENIINERAPRDLYAPEQAERLHKSVHSMLRHQRDRTLERIRVAVHQAWGEMGALYSTDPETAELRKQLEEVMEGLNKLQRKD